MWSLTFADMRFPEMTPGQAQSFPTPVLIDPTESYPIPRPIPHFAGMDLVGSNYRQSLMF